jgi:AcrR family transcriptional regulator
VSRGLVRGAVTRGSTHAFSTNRVTKIAGVSPGSLYPYFPDKSALLDIIRDQYWDGVASRVASSLCDRVGDVGPTTTRDIADALLTALAGC